MRHYYDVYCLLQDVETVRFIGTPEYLAHKEQSRAADHPIIAENEAFLLVIKATRNLYKSAYQSTHALYYQAQPDFNRILEKVGECVQSL